MDAITGILVPSEKQQLRREIRSRIAAMSPQHRADAARCVGEAIGGLANGRSVNSVAAYLATDIELSLDECIATLLHDRYIVACPVVDWTARTMRFDRMISLTDVRVGEKAIREPTSGEPIVIENIELLLVPGVAFDREGRRLGRGGGFYDRVLADDGLRALRCGVAYDGQIVERVPAEAHDQQVDMIITPSETIVARRRGSTTPRSE